MVMAVEKCSYPELRHVKAVMSSYTLATSARESINEFTTIGRDAEQCCRRDTNMVNLSQACRNFVSASKACDTAALSLQKMENSNKESYKVWFNMNPTHAMKIMQHEVLVEALAFISKDRATDVQHRLQDCKRASCGYEVGGEKDWKKDIAEPMDLKKVTEVAGASIGKMEGKTGDKIKAFEEDRVAG